MFKLPRLVKIGLGLLLASVILLFGFGYSNLFIHTNSVAAEKETQMNDSSKKNLKSSQTKNDNKVAAQSATEQKPEQQTKSKPVNWLLPTGGAYPVIGPNDPIWIQVSKEKQRVYIMNGNNVIYTMVCSTGLDTSPDTSTPEGTFYIQRERGTSFYNPNEGEGAKYWVSWKNHGEFLFHSVATDKNGNIIQSEAEKLGQKASHGCVRLAVSDAKWIYDNIQYNTKVVIS
jgi:lipoprotein-anchoring transpeptidase ErfK/SrfK